VREKVKKEEEEEEGCGRCNSENGLMLASHSIDVGRKRSRCHHM
jgi:hypothetical protein